MHYLIPLYCVITAISALFAAMHWKLMLVFYILASSILALAVGSDLRSIVRRESVVQKMIHALMAVAMLIAAFWFGLYYRIDLYFYFMGGTIWVILGVALGFFTNDNIRERRKRRRD